jgi:hypothetical protein
MPRVKTKKPNKQEEPITISDIEVLLSSFFDDLRELINQKQSLQLTRIETKLDKYLDFMSEIAADIKIIKRSTVFLAREHLTYEELRDLAIVVKDVEKDELSGKSKIKN